MFDQLVHRHVKPLGHAGDVLGQFLARGLDLLLAGQPREDEVRLDPELRAHLRVLENFVLLAEQILVAQAARLLGLDNLADHAARFAHDHGSGDFKLHGFDQMLDRRRPLFALGLFGRRRFEKPDGYRRFLQLVAHEYLHQWNVRRLRPSEFIPYRYDRPVISDGLWFAEGVTSYFDLALPLLAGVSSRLDLLKDLGADLSHVLLNPGYAIQSLADSSREAWVRLYKQTPANAHSQISYYRLGTAMAFCLDVHLRQSQLSLAEVLRCLWKRFGVHGRGYRRSDLLACFSEYSKDLETLLPEWLDGRSALPIEASLQRIGLSLNPVHDKTPSAGWLIRERQGRVWIDRTDVDGPAQRGGLVAGDEVVALRDWRCHSVQRCSELLQGDSNLKVTYSRRGV